MSSKRIESFEKTTEDDDLPGFNLSCFMLNNEEQFHLREMLGGSYLPEGIGVDLVLLREQAIMIRDLLDAVLGK